MTDAPEGGWAVEFEEFEYDGGMNTKNASRADAGARLTELAGRWREFWSGYWKSPHGC